MQKMKEGDQMDLQGEKLQIFDSVIAVISSIVTVVGVIGKMPKTILCISGFCLLFTGVMSCVYWRIKYPVLKRYKFIRYLFMAVSENKFNIAPKILLFLDCQKKRNKFEVENMIVSYELTENNGKIDSKVLWKMEDVSNVKTDDFYFYSGIDLGTIANQKFCIYSNNISKTIALLPDNIIDSGNEVFLYHWDIEPALIKQGNKIDCIELSMDQKESFDFEGRRKEVIYFFPWNFAKKIKKIKFEFIYPASLGDIVVQFFSAGKIEQNRYPFHKSINTKDRESGQKENNKIIYQFTLNKDEINIDNLYFFLLHKRQSDGDKL